MTFNRLKNERSSYLKQHENNPVYWWPYTPEALLEAREKDKPIFLSIGYSSCHWCHVMAYESFENEETAQYLNENFVCIKVDREEYPDLDQYYQQACQIFTGRGGWPLSAFLLPDMKPFFAGTYFPNVSKHGLPAFTDVLKELLRVYKMDRQTVLNNANKVVQTISEGVTPKEKIKYEGEFPSPTSVFHAIEQFQDNEFGGYGDAPKFPNFAFWEWAVEQILEGMVEQKYADHIVKSLERMLMGGIVDQVRGGIHRYSTDKQWLVPHFEKMLYDQAGLLKLLSKFSLVYPSPLVFDTLISTLDYLQNEMSSEENIFFSAQDADSEGIEGFYFGFTEEEFVHIIEEDEELKKDVQQIVQWLQIKKEGNYHHQLNVIALNPNLKNEYYTPENWQKVRKIKTLLSNERKLRVPPGTDSKGISSWNFMLISALMDVIQYTKIDTIRNMATHLLNRTVGPIKETFLRSLPPENLPDTEGVQVSIRHATTKDFSLPYLEDYVFFIEAQFRLAEITGNEILREQAYEGVRLILKEFMKDGILYTRAIKSNENELYPNLAAPLYDTAFKSPVFTLMLLVRRMSVAVQDLELLDSVKQLKENLVQEVLHHPLNAGEGLRALSYPDYAYRVLHMPRSWTNKNEFLQLMAHLGSRFVLHFHEEEKEEKEKKIEKIETWQICNIRECELKGDGLKEFIQTLSPAQPQSESQEE